MRKCFLFLLSIGLLASAVPASSAHFCADSGIARICEDHCPAEGPAQHQGAGHERDEESGSSGCCTHASFAVSPLNIVIARASNGFSFSKVSVESIYLTPARDVFHPPA